VKFARWQNITSVRTVKAAIVYTTELNITTDASILTCYYRVKLSMQIAEMYRPIDLMRFVNVFVNVSSRFRLQGEPKANH